MSSSISTGKSIAELKALVEQDRAMADQLQVRIEQLRQNIQDGKLAKAEHNLNIMEHSNKRVTRELVARMEQIEEQSSLTPTDREMLQALNARLAVCDLQATKMAELGELEEQARRARNVDATENEHKNEEAEEELAVPKVDHMQGASHMPVFTEGGVSFMDLDSDDDNDPEEDVDVRRKNESWLAPYHILDLDHDLADAEISTQARKALARLSAKHNPTRLPNDPDAARRWEIIMKAYELVSDPDKRRYLETSHKLPTELVDLDIADLKLD